MNAKCLVTAKLRNLNFSRSPGRIPVALLIVAMALALLVGQAIHSPLARAYSCVSQHCGQVAHWAYPTITGSFTDIDVVHTSCNGCDGFVDNEIWEYERNDAGCYLGICWLETGYTTPTNKASGVNYYFYARTYPDDGGQLHQSFPEQVPSGDYGSSWSFQIDKVSSETWEITAGSYYNGSVYDDMTTNDGYVEIGQELSGTTGAYAPLANYQYTEYRDGSNNWHYEGGTTILTSGSPPPPYYSFTYNAYGDKYQSWCCSATPSTAGTTGASAASSASTEGMTPHQSAISSGLVGIPAIQTRFASADTSQATFSADDAAHYALTNGMARGVITKPLAVDGVFFTAPQSAPATLRKALNDLGQDRLLCIVELHGAVVFAGPDGISVTASHVYEVFDAHTGNLLANGQF